VRPQGFGPPNGPEVNPRGQGPRAEADAARRLPACESRDAGGVTPCRYRCPRRLGRRTEAGPRRVLPRVRRPFSGSIYFGHRMSTTQDSEIKARASTGEEPWWRPIKDFAVHVTVGSLIFAVIATPAVLIDVALRQVAFGDTFLGWGLRVGEYAIFVADLLLFLVFLVRAVWRASKRL
jgi:hypothetical protein